MNERQRHFQQAAYYAAVTLKWERMVCMAAYAWGWEKQQQKEDACVEQTLLDYEEKERSREL